VRRLREVVSLSLRFTNKQGKREREREERERNHQRERERHLSLSLWLVFTLLFSIERIIKEQPTVSVIRYREHVTKY